MKKILILLAVLFLLVSCVTTKKISEKPSDFPETFEEADVWVENQFEPLENLINFSSDTLIESKIVTVL